MSGSVEFSIVIPTRERPRELATCLSSIAKLEFPRDRFEVIVVDDGSAVPLDQVVDRFQEMLDLRLLTRMNRGPAAARNAGAEVAQGRFLAFTDDDCSPAPDWLQRMFDRCTARPGCLVGGRTVNSLEENLFASASQDLISYLYDYFNADENQARFLTSNNIAVAAQDYRALGGFDQGYPNAAGEDRDFCDRWRASGSGMIYAPEVVVHHAHRLNLWSFWKQHFGYGRGAHRYQRARAQRTDTRQRFEPLGFYVGMLWYPFASRYGWFRASLLSILLAVSQVANAAGFIRELIGGSVDSRALNS